MSTARITARPNPSLRPHLVRRIVLVAVVVVVLALMLLSTKFVPAGSAIAAGEQAFNPATYGKQHFPMQQHFIARHAVDAATLATGLATDATGTAKKYGTPNRSGVGTVIPVRFTGVVGKPDATGLPTVKVPGVPAGTIVHVQTGPAINGTDLRDVSGTIRFEQFTNQIDYQNAGAALNNELRSKVLKKIDGASLVGKTVSVTGAFTEINPKSWNVTPATIAVR